MKKKHEVEKPAHSKRHIPAWQKALLALALLLGLTGLGLSAFGGSGEKSSKSESATAKSGASAHPVSGGESLMPGESPPYREPGDSSTSSSTSVSSSSSDSGDSGGSGSSDLGGPLAKLGFSFVAGFAIAYALRVFLKITLFVGGGILILLFGLQYLGWIHVDWTLFEKGYDSLAGFISANAGAMKDFVTSHLPSTASAVAGMVVGFKRG